MIPVALAGLVPFGHQFLGKPNPGTASAAGSQELNRGESALASLPSLHFYKWSQNAVNLHATEACC